MMRVSREQAARRAMEIALRTATPVLGSRDDAADVAQDVALDVLKSLRTLRDPQAFDAWVRRIAVRHTMRAARARRARATDVPTDLARAHLDEPVDRDLAIASRQALTGALDALPPRQALALVLRYVFDLPDREIAAALGCRRGTVHALVSRGRAALREMPAIRELASETERTP
jgi:RNA polymerase sigma factor (sigma-70 family)